MAGALACRAQIVHSTAQKFIFHVFCWNISAMRTYSPTKYLKKNLSFTSLNGKNKWGDFWYFMGGLYIDFPAVFPKIYSLKTKPQIKIQCSKLSLLSLSIHPTLKKLWSMYKKIKFLKSLLNFVVINLKGMISFTLDIHVPKKSFRIWFLHSPKNKGFSSHIDFLYKMKLWINYDELFWVNVF